MDPLVAQRNHRIIWSVATVLVAMLALAQRDERALLMQQKTPSTISAFAAITPQSPGMSFAAAGTGTPSSGSHAPTRHWGGGGAAGFAPTSDSDDAPAGSGSSAFDQPSDQPAAPSALLALADPSGGGGINYGPGVAPVGSVSSPGGPQQTVSGSDPGVVDAVPEAPTWMIMLLGIAGLGGLARYRRARGTPLLPASRG